MRRRFTKTTSSKLSQFDINNYITIEALEDNLTIEVGIYNGRAYYGIDGIGWNEYDPNSEILLNKGQTISFKGTNAKTQFYIDKPCNILGNGYSLLVGDDAVNITDISSFGNSILSFSSCPIINVASSFLPATTLATGCYQSMFFGCTSLTTAPELPAINLAKECYQSMFYGCTKLNYIKMLATNISATYCLEDWVRGVATTGTFVMNPNARWEVYGNSGIPNGWKVKFDGEEEYGEEITFYLDTMPIGDCYTLTARDGMTWADWVESEYNTIGVELCESEDYINVAWNGLIITNYWSGVSIKHTDKIISEETYGIY